MKISNHVQISSKQFLLHILHTTPQTRLQRLGMPPEQIHHQRPTQARKHRPRPLRNRTPLVPHQAKATAARRGRVPGLDTQLGQGEDDAGEDVDDDLLVDGALDAAAEDGPAAEQAGEEGVQVRFFARGAEQPQREQAGFVGQGEEGEVAGVLARRFDDDAGFFAEGARAEEEDHARVEGFS